jgi:hypothetical protein
MKKVLRIILISLMLVVLASGALISCSNETTGVPSNPPPVPAAPNDSIVTAKVISTVKQAGETQLTIEIQSSADIPGLANRTRGLIGKQITVIDDEDTSTVKAGQTITAHVKYQGDEKGGSYYASQVK